MSDAPPTPGPDGNRDAASGRWLHGNKAGKGCSTHIKAAAIKRELTDALTDNLQRVAASLVERAVAGDPVCARILLDRACGTPRAEVPEPVVFPLPDLVNLEAVAVASARIVASVAAGELDAETAAQLLGVVGQTRAALEAAKLEQLAARIDALEQDRQP